jgi:preprotein translocase subunit SecB
MTEGNGNAPEGAAPQAAAQPRMQVLAQFIRDLSFENVLAQKGIQGEVTPEIQVQVNIDARKRSQENQYELVMTFKVSSKNRNGGEQLFLLEIDYGGVFLLEGIPEQQIHPFLMIECPRMLFPFVRRIISDVTRDGGFPAVNIDVVDFMGIYRQELARRAAAEQAQGNAPPVTQ